MSPSPDPDNSSEQGISDERISQAVNEVVEGVYASKTLAETLREQLKPTAPDIIEPAPSESSPAAPIHAPSTLPPTQDPPPATSPASPPESLPTWVIPTLTVLVAGVVTLAISLTVVINVRPTDQGIQNDNSQTIEPVSGQTSDAPSEEATSAAAPIQPSPEPTPFVEPRVIYSGTEIKIPELSWYGEPHASIDLDTPEILLEEAAEMADAQPIDFVYEAGYIDGEDDAIWSYHAQMGLPQDDAPTAESCTTAVRTSPMPEPNYAIDLAIGDRFCVLTSEGNVGLMEIVDINGSGEPYSAPALSFEVTLWSVP